MFVGSPEHKGFVGNDGGSSLHTQPTCSADAPSDAGAGNYATKCTDAVDSNYRFSYLNGTLTIEKAATTLAVSAALVSAVKGVTASYSGDSNSKESSAASAVMVNKASTSTAVSASASPSIGDQSVTFHGDSRGR